MSSERLGLWLSVFLVVCFLIVQGGLVQFLPVILQWIVGVGIALFVVVLIFSAWEEGRSSRKR